MSYDDVLKLALERGFYFPSCEPYGDAHAGFWEYGPSGVALKNKFLHLWRRQMVRRGGMIEIDGSQIMSKSVFEASGHLAGFADPITRCSKCGATFRADRMIAEECGVEIAEAADPAEFDVAIAENKITCLKCKSPLDAVRRFNMMFQVGIGPDGEAAYLRPETCQSIFVDFPRLFKTMRGKLPLGIAQVGKSFRNEISPRQGLLRLREFYQAEIEVFCNPASLDSILGWEEIADVMITLEIDGTRTETTCAMAVESALVPNRMMAFYFGLLADFYKKTGVDMKKSRFRRLGEKERAFYAESAFDFEIETDIGWLELVACNYRSAHDLKSHAAKSKEKFEVMDGEEKVLPHVFEISMGIDRSLYTMLEFGLHTELLKNDGKESERTLLSLKPYLAPFQVAVLSLIKKDGLREKADQIHIRLRRNFDAFVDHSGAIGRRYRRQDEIGTPYAITVDHQTKEDGTVTLRERDTMDQKRISIDDLETVLSTSTAFP
ncbi:MAG: glycine--tRNA ligase [Cenarchaeum symbiont of Oopsacas minuta]|nr:glycine--tRNA ligase [Cenarchaeum symbiont of Oopsacas minuta]